MLRIQNMMAARKLRIAGIVTLFVVLIIVFLRFDEHTSSFPAQFRNFAQHHGSSTNQSPPQSPPPTSNEGIRWSDFAYVQYVTNSNYLCNSLMIFEALRRHGTKADLLMLYPRDWKLPEDEHGGADIGYESGLLAQARDQYGTKLSPIQVQTITNGNDPTWQDSYTKLLAWNQTQYKRVISLDSDATVLNHMDELFLLLPAPVAMPRAYWIDQPFLSSQMIILEPSEGSWQLLQNATEHHEGHDYDMDILNKVYGKSCLVIPHRRYNLLTGEFRHDLDKHEAYFGSSAERWNARDALAEAKFVHFSDWPMPKPWLRPSKQQIEKHQPACWKVSETEQDCTDREVWLELRKDFSDRRLRICGREYDGA